MMRLAIALFASVALLTSTPAFADEEELVETVAGATYRGVLVERVPDDHLTIRLATGEVKRFAWNEIKTAKTVAAVIAPAPTPRPSMEAARRRVRVVVDAADASLERRETPANDAPWRVVCRAPCGEPVDTRGEHRVIAPDKVPTAPFVLGGSGDTTVHVSLGSSWARLAGITSVAVGATLVAGGAVVFYGAPGNCNEPCAISGIRAVGLGIGAVGLVTLVAGIILWTTSTSTARVEPQPPTSTSRDR